MPSSGGLNISQNKANQSGGMMLVEEKVNATEPLIEENSS